MATTKTQPAFEELYRQLEEKVGRLEQGGLSLDESLSTYEEAVGLARRCQEMLEQAELRITRLKETAIGISEAPERYEAGGEEEEGEEDDDAL